MRYFTLENSQGRELDITTTQYLFHELGGLGFSEETSFRRLGENWWLDSVNYAQGEITGKMMFTELGGTTPYQKYITFRDFIERAPLILNYYPHGIEGHTPFKRRVRVTNLNKTEYDEYGVLDCDITFAAYTPWYEIVTRTNANTFAEEEGELGWIWDYPLAFEPKPEVVGGQRSYYIIDDRGVKRTALRARFGGEPVQTVELPSIAGAKGSPVKLTIQGPAMNPSWSLYVNDALTETGGFASNLSLSSSQTLTIDNTTGKYTMTVYSAQSDTTVDVYPSRDFDKVCFLTLRNGRNTIAVSGSNGVPIKFSIEGHIYHATV